MAEGNLFFWCTWARGFTHAASTVAYCRRHSTLDSKWKRIKMREIKRGTQRRHRLRLYSIFEKCVMQYAGKKCLAFAVAVEDSLSFCGVTETSIKVYAPTSVTKVLRSVLLFIYLFVAVAVRAVQPCRCRVLRIAWLFVRIAKNACSRIVRQHLLHFSQLKNNKIAARRTIRNAAKAKNETNMQNVGLSCEFRLHLQPHSHSPARGFCFVGQTRQTATEIRLASKSSQTKS